MSILFLEINFKEKSNTMKVAFDELLGDYFKSKRLKLFLIHEIRPSKPTIKVRIIENSYGDHKIVTQINWDNFIWAIQRAVTYPETKLGLYLRDIAEPPIGKPECVISAYVSYQRLGSP